MACAIDPEDPSLGGNMIGGDPKSYFPELWSFLVERFAIKSMLDVGCGEGECVQYFHDIGIDAHGFDGLKANIEIARGLTALHDIRSGPFIMPVDLAYSCEFVEHIYEQYLDHVLRTLANGRIIAMTHGLPGQGGHHHVNCQPPEYWRGHLDNLGYRFLTNVTEEGKDRIRAAGRQSYFIDSGMIFERTNVFA